MKPFRINANFYALLHPRGGDEFRSLVLAVARSQGGWWHVEHPSDVRRVIRLCEQVPAAHKSDLPAWQYAMVASKTIKRAKAWLTENGYE